MSAITTRRARQEATIVLIIIFSMSAAALLLTSVSTSWSYSQSSSSQPPSNRQEVRRGIEPPAPAPVIVQSTGPTSTPAPTPSSPSPLPVVQTQLPLPVVTQIPWGQILSMMAVLGAISSAVQWLLTKTIIQPQIQNAITSVSSDVRVWAITQFPSKSDFDIHTLKDTQAHDLINQRYNDLLHDLSQTAERAAVLHDKVIVLETANRKV